MSLVSLLVDVGNSRLKWALWQAGVRGPQQAMAYAGVEPPSAALHAVQQLLLMHPQVRQLVMVHVLGSTWTTALQALAQQQQVQLILAQAAHASHYGVQLAYPNPAQLGADRWVGLLAARQLLGTQAVIVIDCGTAVTVDALQADGVHRGGVIMPGLQLLSEVLIRRTQAQHMDATPFDNPQVFATNTRAGMGSGCLFSLVGGLEGVVARMQAQLPEAATVLLCGGDTALLSPHLSFAHQAQPDALLDGLAYLAQQGVVA